MSATTPGLVCGHHRLYASLARAVPPSSRPTTTLRRLLEQVWWRADAAVELETIRWSTMLGAVEALQSGTVAIVDHHESPSAIEGSLDVVAQACAEVGVLVSCSYAVSDRHGADGARRGLAENERYLRAGGRGMVGIDAASSCGDQTLEAAVGLADDLGVGVHVRVAEDADDHAAGARLEPLARAGWLLAHCVSLDRELPGTIAHNPRSNLDNAVGYAAPASRTNPVVLGTDGIGADVLEEFRLAAALHRSHDPGASPETAWSWVEEGWNLVPEARDTSVAWSYRHLDSAWHAAYATGVRAVDVQAPDGSFLLKDGKPTRVDLHEVRTKAAEHARRLFRSTSA